jgi:hypothetical protein
METLAKHVASKIFILLPHGKLIHSGFHHVRVGTIGSSLWLGLLAQQVAINVLRRQGLFQTCSENDPITAIGLEHQNIEQVVFHNGGRHGAAAGAQ